MIAGGERFLHELDAGDGDQSGVAPGSLSFEFAYEGLCELLRRRRREEWCRAPVLSVAVEDTDADAVVAFNDAINAQDLGALTALMSSDHRFVDSAGRAVVGLQACRSAWALFFDSFPDYRNVFERITVTAPGQVAVDGRSECAFEPLRGPARWHAAVVDGSIVEWRVESPTE